MYVSEFIILDMLLQNIQLLFIINHIQCNRYLKYIFTNFNFQNNIYAKKNSFPKIRFNIY